MITMYEFNKYQKQREQDVGETSEQTEEKTEEKEEHDGLE